jgi:uncharacterized protein (DUF433 family)
MYIPRIAGGQPFWSAAMQSPLFVAFGAELGISLPAANAAMNQDRLSVCSNEARIKGNRLVVWTVPAFAPPSRRGESAMAHFDRITFEPHMMGGRACIRGMRIPVSVIVSQIAHGATTAEILEGYPDLEREDIQQAIEYAAWLTQEEVLGV